MQRSFKQKCLMPLRTFVTLSCFDKGKENRIVRCKWPRNPMFNFEATLLQRCDNVLTKSESEIVTTLENDVGTTLIFDRATTLWQLQHRRCDNGVTKSLCQLGGRILESFTYQNGVQTSFCYYFCCFQQIISNYFVQFGAEWLNVNSYFSRELNKYEINFTWFL